VHSLPVNIAGIDTSRVECNMVFNGFIAGGKIVVAPSSILRYFFSYFKGVVGCDTFEFAETLMICAP